MTGAEARALAAQVRALAHAWLEEVRADGLEVLAASPPLEHALQAAGVPAEGTLTELAVEYQRLFGFGVPPYESVFLDPSAMLMAPATARVQALYRRVGWTPPPARVGAADHVGLELWLLADLLATGRRNEAERLVRDHLAFWLPVLVLTVQRLAPAPFYAVLAEQTVALVLPLLGEVPPSVHLPLLPPPPRYEARGLPEPPEANGHREDGDSLNELVRRLLTPREAGFYLTREDIGRLSQGAALPPAIADRRAMLRQLFHLAGQYDEVEGVLAALRALVGDVARAYEGLAQAFPGWRPYAACWLERLEATAEVLEV